MKKVRIAVPAALVIAAIILAIMAVATVNSSDYRLYKSEYYSCQSSYLECKREARNAEYAITQQLWEDLADDYDDLMDGWEERIEREEAKATTYGIFAGVCAVGAVVFFFVARKSKANEAVVADDSVTEPEAGQSDNETII
ncbi:MAG: hypothetical protein E7647_05085 [Ruminococcaceae bacterium]|nr:hypothetical protein [Oscillospiraceae bacterium]